MNEGQRREKKRAMMSWMTWDPLDYLLFALVFIFYLGVWVPFPATTVFMDWMIKTTARGVWIKRLSTVQPQSNDTLYFTYNLFFLVHFHFFPTSKLNGKEKNKIKPFIPIRNLRKVHVFPSDSIFFVFIWFFISLRWLGSVNYCKLYIN